MKKEDYKKKLIHTKDELQFLQSLSLEDKIALSKARIYEWYEYWHGKVSVSYSGGKDSTVLLRLVRDEFPDVPAVYIDSGLDFPEVREQVAKTENVIRLKPTMSFRQIISKYGFVFPSKNTATHIENAKRGVHYAVMYMNGKNYDGSPSEYNESTYGRWRHLLDAPFQISSKCCEYIKEKPLNQYEKETGNKPYVGILASESKRRTDAWLRTGCNVFKSKRPISKPLSFWTEQDILRYIVKNKIEIASVYGNIIERKGKLETTGMKRTGCMFCLIGCHLEKPNRFQLMKETHPEIYKYCMTQLGLEEVLTWLKIAH